MQLKHCSLSGSVRTSFLPAQLTAVPFPARAQVRLLAAGHGRQRARVPRRLGAGGVRGPGDGPGPVHQGQAGELRQTLSVLGWTYAQNGSAGYDRHRLAHRHQLSSIQGRASCCTTTDRFFECLFPHIEQHLAAPGSTPLLGNVHWRVCQLIRTHTNHACMQMAALSSARPCPAAGAQSVIHYLGTVHSRICMQVAAFELGKAMPGGAPLPLSKVRVGDTGSDVHPGCGATWSSTGSEGACQVPSHMPVQKQTLTCLDSQCDPGAPWGQRAPARYAWRASTRPAQGFADPGGSITLGPVV